MRHIWVSLALAFCASAIVAGLAQTREPNSPSRNKGVAPLEPGEAKHYEDRGIAHLQEGAVDDAIRDLDRAIQMNPASATAILYRASAYRAKGAWEQSLRDWNSYISLNASNAFAYKSRASVYNVTGEFDRAITDWDEGLRLDPKDSIALAMRGFAYAKKAQYRRAQDDFTAALRLDPLNQSAHNNLAWLRATCPVKAMRNGKEAVREATKACELTSWTNWTRIDTLAAALAEAGRFKKAVDCQKRAMQMSGVSRDDHDAMQLRLARYEQKQPYYEAQP